MGIVIKIFVEDNKKELNVVVWNDDSKRNKSTENKSKVVADFKVPLNTEKLNEPILDDIEWEDCKLERFSNQGDEDEIVADVEDNFIDMNNIQCDNSDPFSDDLMSHNVDGNQPVANLPIQVPTDFFVIENIVSFQPKTNPSRPVSTQNKNVKPKKNSFGPVSTFNQNSTELAMQNCNQSLIQTSSASVKTVKKRVYKKRQNVSINSEQKYSNASVSTKSYSSQKSKCSYTKRSEVFANNVSVNHNVSVIGDPKGNSVDDTENGYCDDNHSTSLLNFSEDISHMVDVNIEESNEVIEQNFTNYQYSRENYYIDYENQSKSKKFHLSCRECDFSCNRKGDLKVHRKLHKIKKPTCDICGYSNSNKRTLNIHKKRHSIAEAYPCSYCDYICSKKYFLPLHERVHTGEKPYTCKYCEYKCSQKGSLTFHMKNKHLFEFNNSLSKPLSQLTSS